MARDRDLELFALQQRGSTQRSWSVIAYVIEEVQRQGHDTSKLDGIQRVGWMLNAWSYALEQSSAGNSPTLRIACELGKLIEPVKNKGGWRECQVRVGQRLCPDYREIYDRLERLFDQFDMQSPAVEVYKEFELIHPFVDGNGRTGKIILNWINGTLLAPVFPPADLFGHPIGNP